MMIFEKNDVATISDTYLKVLCADEEFAVMVPIVEKVDEEGHLYYNENFDDVVIYPNQIFFLKTIEGLIEINRLPIEDLFLPSQL